MRNTSYREEEKIIIVVEDDEANAETLTLLLESEKAFQVATFQTGEELLESIEQIKRQHPHLFIIDYMLPYMSGIELFDQLQRVRELHDIPALLMTASCQREVEEEVSSRQLAIVQKPFEVDTFLNTVSQLAEA